MQYIVDDSNLGLAYNADVVASLPEKSRVGGPFTDPSPGPRPLPLVHFVIGVTLPPKFLRVSLKRERELSE